MEKTCGNCGNAIPIPIEEEDGTMRYDMISVCPGDWCIDLIRNEPNFVGHTPDTEPCEQWTEATDTLEQRYQQLAEVARGMLEEIKTMAGSYGYTADLNYEHKYEWIEDCVRPWREKLEELGVEL